MQQRIHKILAHAGHGSRRSCEELIEGGRVTVNGKVATVGDKATLGSDDIRIDGHRVRAERKVYFLLNKPKGMICTNSDPYGRPKVADLTAGIAERVYPVGRLDADSRGLLIMTNDGELAARLTHKTYEVEIAGQMTGQDVQKLISGVWLNEGRTRSSQVRVLHRGGRRSLIEITLREGRNRQVRRMLAKLNHPVKNLTRTRIGRLTLKGLGTRKFRPLTQRELQALVKLCRDKPEAETPVSGDKAPAGAKKAKVRQRKAKAKKPTAKRQHKKSGPATETGREVSEFTF
ncbi:MAG: pseudouridine synthase [Anaerolineaceae bacterium]|nr:pseudouridine synthase [Anaerolineaceae bacterium]